MPATEETYRPQPILHVVFAISSIAMLASIVWMVAADHLRPWKEVQREFQTVERDKLEASLKEKQDEQKQKYQTQIDEIDQKIKDAEANADAQAAEIARLDRELDTEGGKVQLLDMQRRFQKAELDSKRSLYDGMIERNEEAAARAFLTNVVSHAESELNKLSKELEKADSERKATLAKKDDLLHHIDNLKKEKERLTREADRVERAIKQKDELYGGPDHWYSARWPSSAACPASI